MPSVAEKLSRLPQLALSSGTTDYSAWKNATPPTDAIRIKVPSLAWQTISGSGAVKYSCGMQHLVFEEATDALLTYACAKIDSYRTLRPNWDGEDARPVEREVRSRAKELLRLAARTAFASEIRWHRPSIAPNPDGGIDLSWEVGRRWAMLTIAPGQTSVECVTQEEGSQPNFQLESVGDAIERALWAMRGG